MADDGSRMEGVEATSVVAAAAATPANAPPPPLPQQQQQQQRPGSASAPDVEMKEAVAWAVVSGTLIAVARMLATRRAATYYEKSTGHLPPELRKDNQDADAADAPTT